MEDPSENWEIQEHSSSDESHSKVRWVLHKGLNLGKKIVITGVVISSAPLVLPPLLVISALGFAFSVPFGLVFVSYACTEKLMSKLLPGPRSPLMLGNGMLSDGEIEEEDEFGFREGKHWQKGDEIGYQEPVEEVDDEIVKDWGYEEDAGEYLEPMVNSYGHKSTEKDDKEPRNYGDDIVEEDGYVKDVGEDLEGKDKEPLERRDVRIEGIGKEVPVAERSKWEQPVDVHRVDVVGKSEKNGDVITGAVLDRERDDKVDTCNKDEDLARETTGLLQKVRNEGDVGDPVGKDKGQGQGKEISGIAKDTDHKNLTLAAEMKKPSEVKSVKLEKLIGKMKGGKKRNKGPKQSKEIRERTTEENVDAIPGVAEQVVEGIKEDNRDEMKAEKVVVVEEPIGDISKPLKGNTFVKAASRNGAGEKYSNTTDEKPEEYQNISCRTSEGSLELTELKHGGIDTVMPASKVPLSEKKIWEHIEALRTIVGYKAAPHATCVEEIKALYIFTGVEPPAASFRDPSDLVEVNDRLQFLMSIVGVK